MSHPNPRKVAPIALAIIVLASLTYWFFVVRPAQAGEESLSASGTIEATQVRISPEIGGRVLEVLAEKGEYVQAGDILVKIDPALLLAQRDQAAAAVDVAQANVGVADANAESAAFQVMAAESAHAAAQAAHAAASANLALLEAGATAEQLEAANQQVIQAQASYQAALAGYAALTVGVRPEDVSAAQSRLDEARKAYYGLTVMPSDDQIENFELASEQAQINVSNTITLQNDLRADAETPAAVLPALMTAEEEARSVQSAADAALESILNNALPFYRQIEAARQSLDAAELALAQAEARQTTLEAVEDVTEAVQDGLQEQIDDAQEMVDEAQTAYDDLNDSDQGQQLQAAWDEVETALADLNRLARSGATSLETVLYQLDAAEALRSAAQANYDQLASGARTEQIASAQAQVDAAQAQLDSAQANWDAAQARAEAAQAQAEVAAAQVAASKTAVEGVDVQIARLTLSASIKGVVLARSIEPGELAVPGAVLLVLSDLNRLTITVYLPEDRYGEVNLGQEVTVSVDSFPGQAFTAQVTHIADQAEFTPRNVQTAEGRRTTVFAVTLAIENVEGKLKPGMPADVSFDE